MPSKAQQHGPCSFSFCFCFFFSSPSFLVLFGFSAPMIDVGKFGWLVIHRGCAELSIASAAVASLATVDLGETDCLT